MAVTRSGILAIGENLIRRRGYNAFSYHDISVTLGIKNAAVHYYFPKKSDLAIEIIRTTYGKIEAINRATGPLQQLNAIIAIYTRSHEDNKVCLIGALAAEFYSLDPSVQGEIRKVVIQLQSLTQDVLTEGKQQGIFYFDTTAEVKAMLLITNLLAALQIERITGKDEFTPIRDALISELTTPLH